MKKLICHCVLAMGLVFPMLAFATDYYVDTNAGDNDNNGLTEMTAWKTITKSNAIVQPGDVVYILEGTYTNDPVWPATSGTEGNYITYRNYPSHEVTLTMAINLVNLYQKSYIIVDGLNLIHAQNSWIILTEASHCTIKNCYCSWAVAYSGVDMYKTQYCKILNSSFHGYCDYEEPQDGGTGQGPANLFWIQESSYNLLEGNDLGKATHYCISLFGRPFSERNIIRNNRFHNEWHGGLGLGENSIYNVIHGNTFFDHGEEHETNYCGNDKDRGMDRDKQLAFQLHSHYTIIRNNVFVNNGRFTDRNPREQYPEATDNILVNNVFYGQHGEAVTNSIPLPRVAVINCAFGENIKGDILYPNPASGMIDNNNFSDRSPVEGAINSTTFSEPLFVDKDKRDFLLQADSPLIDAGKFPTQTVSADSGLVIVVEQAQFFTDGCRITEGDLIQLEGQSIRARVLEVDYGAQTLTVDTYLKWDAGTGVALAYTGAAPDIGAFEYGQGMASSNQAKKPAPANGATGTAVTAQLSWTSGEDAVSHNIYWGTTSEVEFRVNQINTVFDPGALMHNMTYYWRVDEVTATNTIMGNIWSFTTTDEALAPEMAFNPTPESKSEDIAVNLLLSWKPGRRATGHDVYFGTENPPEFVGNQSARSFDPGELDWNTTYYWRVDETNDYGTIEGDVWSFTTKAEVFLPENWCSQDIGSVGVFGSANFSNASGFTVQGSGADIGEGIDAFHFTFIPFSGDGTVIARVVSLESANPDAKAGIMIRESLEPDSKYAMVFVTAGNGNGYQNRPTTGSRSSRFAGSSGSAPCWLRMRRSASQYFLGHESPDGIDWTIIKNEKFTMNTDAYIGLAVTAADNDSLCTAVFDNVMVNDELVTSLQANHEIELPKTFTVSNYPNPFNPNTWIQFELPEPGKVTITVYDIMGRKIDELLHQNHSAGVFILEWGGTDTNERPIASGLYLYRVTLNKQIKIGKMLLIR